MRFQREEDFAKAYKAEQGIKGLCLLCGSEDYLIEAWRRKILGKNAAEEGFNFQKIDGRSPDWDALYDATQTLPLFAEEKYVLLENLDASKMTADDILKLTDIFEQCPDECILLVTARPPGFDGKSAAAKKVIAAADKHGWVAELGARTSGGLVKFLQQSAAREGCGISPAVCRELIETAGSDMLTLSREVEKLCAYAGGGEIQSGHIQAVVTARTEAKVFDLSKMILAGNGQRAMEILSDLFFLREAPVAILNVLSMAYTDLYRARVARDSGIPAPEVIAKFGYKGREFRINNAYNSRMSAAALRRSLAMLSECDLKMKSTGADDKILLEQAVAGLLLARES